MQHEAVIEAMQARLDWAPTTPAPPGARASLRHNKIVDDATHFQMKTLKHVSTRPRAYKQDADAIAAFKKTCSVPCALNLEPTPALVLPFCNSETMQLHLDEIATKVTPGAHAIIILDQAGWHGAKQLKVPHNISLLPLPPRSPELNSQENIWQFRQIPYVYLASDATDPFGNAKIRL